MATLKRAMIIKSGLKQLHAKIFLHHSVCHIMIILQIGRFTRILCRRLLHFLLGVNLSHNLNESESKGDLAIGIPLWNELVEILEPDIIFMSLNKNTLAILIFIKLLGIISLTTTKNIMANR